MAAMKHDILPDFRAVPFEISNNPKTRSYELLEMKRLYERGIPSRMPRRLVENFQRAGRDDVPTQDPPWEAWEIRHRRNPDLLDTPHKHAVITPFHHAQASNMYVPMGAFGHKVTAGALFTWGTDHRRRKMVFSQPPRPTVPQQLPVHSGEIDLGYDNRVFC